MGGRRTNTFVRAYNSDAMDRVRARLDGFSEENLQRAVQRADVGVVRKVQPIAKRNIRERYGVKASQLNGKFKVTQARSRKKEPYIGVWASSRQISLIHFGGRWRGRKAPGATAAVKLGQRKTYNSAFISTVQGLKAIRVRAYKDGPGLKRHGRGPLRMLRGPSPFEMLLGENMANGPEVAEQLLDIRVSEIRRQLELMRSKR